MSEHFDIKVLYDGDCPLCRREVAFLQKFDRHNRIVAEDIAAPDFDARAYGRSQEDLMARIHGVLPDGTVIEGVEVFRRLYRAIGLGWLVAWTRWPGFRWLADVAYRWFARNRLRLTGRTCDAACQTNPRPQGR